MLIDQICELRDKLNQSILTDDYEATYELSIQLDELIAKYYNQGYKCGQSLRHN
ncbi:MAG: aspartyl-phosphate phosphatase Spo0E family protein [Clostridia bacterium]|nr:aspartyl-phosphate phosphatase Spo0E family protein [Clostridia bacterium]